MSRRMVGGLAGVAALATLAGAPAAVAATPAEGTIGSTKASVRWSGDFENQAAPDVEACAVVRCDTFDLKLDLPTDRWSRHGGVIVAIDFAHQVNTADWGWNLDLYVYDSAGRLVDKAESNFAGMAAFLETPANGNYRVVVRPEWAMVGKLSYRGHAAVEYSPAAKPERDLLPNLVALPPSNPQVRSRAIMTPYLGPTTDRGTPPFDSETHGPSSCMPDELQQGARRCLRFDQIVGNVGEGPLELRYRGDPEGEMLQRIYRSDGSWRDEPAGGVEFHVPHLHFHYTGFAQAFLYEATATGGKGDLVRKGSKAGFCMVDTTNLRFGRRGQTASRYLSPCDDMRDDEQGPYVPAGLSPGWADTYPWYAPGQYLEIYGVGDGRYVLELRVNAAGALIEESKADNAASTLIEIDGDDVRVVRVLND